MKDKRITTARPRFMPNLENIGTEIRFGGIRADVLWLRMLGFQPHDKLEITCKNKELIIKPIQDGNS